MSDSALDPLLGAASASWRHARRYDPDDPAGAAVFDDIAVRLEGLNYLDTPVWLFDAERCQFLWANASGLEVWRASDLREAQRRDIASSQSQAVYTLLNDYLEQVRAGRTPAVWVTLSPRGTLQRYYQLHHRFTLRDGRDCLLIEARAEPPAEALLSLASNHSLTLGLYDLHRKLISGNPRFRELRSLNPRLDDLSSLHPEGFARSDWLTHLRGTTELVGSGVLDTARGERPFRWEARLLNERQGGGQVLVSLYDQTDRLVAEAEQARGALLEIALDAILIIDHEGTIIEFNPAAERLFGCVREAVIGRSVASLIIPPELRDANNRGMAWHRALGVRELMGRRLELPALRADGTRFRAEVALIEFKARGRTQFIGFVRDVEALRRVEAQVRSERARFSSVFEYTPDATVILNERGEVLQANLACTRMLGSSTDAMSGVQLSGRLRRWQGDSKGVVVPSHEVRSDSGEWIAVELRSKVFPIQGEEHTVMLLRDLRPQLAAAREKVELAEQLKQSQRLKELGTLAGGVAHYFNNLLAAIVGNVELGGSLPDLSSEARAHFDDVGRVAARGTEMVRRILAFSRKAPSGRESLHVEPIAREAIELVRLAFPPTVQLHLRAPPGLPPVQLNSSQIHQVMVNLLTNACQAIGDRGGEVQVCLQTVVLREPDAGTGLKRGRYLRVDVVDDGPGMEPSTAAQAFHPFFTTKPVDEGTGLGLAEVHGIAAEHGGASVIHTELGEGCRVSLYLPVIRTRPPTSSGSVRAVPGRSTGLTGVRLLYLDDEPALGRLYSRLLRRKGMEVVVFREPLEALDYLRAEPERVDLVMTDISMPQMSGLEFAHRLSSMNAQVPILFASGRDLAELATVELPNPSATIQKPYPSQALIRVLEDLWDRT